jgi:putative ABC transport system permease protein
MGFLIAAIGLYGVIRYAVERRTREWGIRLALGATEASVVALVLRQGAWLAGIGLALGVALAMGRGVQGLLSGVAGSDGLTYALVTPLVQAIALLASWLPARRAARLNPLDTLRCD